MYLRSRICYGPPGTDSSRPEKARATSLHFQAMQRDRESEEFDCATGAWITDVWVSAAGQLWLNPGTGCGRLGGAHRQRWSFCLSEQIQDNTYELGINVTFAVMIGLTISVHLPIHTQWGVGFKRRSALIYTQDSLWRLLLQQKQILPANQRPCRALTAAMAVGIDGHFTYTLPYKSKRRTYWKLE